MIIDISQYPYDPAFMVFCEEELNGCISRPVRHSGRVATREEIAANVLVGKSAEWWLVHNTRLQKLTRQNLQMYKPGLFDRIEPHIKWNDLIDPKNGEIVEVKCWKEPWAYQRGTQGEAKVKEALGKWLFADYMIVFANLGNNKITFAQKIDLM